jgi:hypothetical protein
LNMFLFRTVLNLNIFEFEIFLDLIFLEIWTIFNQIFLI